MVGNKVIREAVVGMFVYFSKRPQETIIDMYVDALTTFNTEYVLQTCKHFITNGEKLPKIVDLANYIRNTWEISEKKEYDPEYDPDFPIDRLWSAFGLLIKTNGNMQQFHDYCEKHKVPRQDRNGVIAKYVVSQKANKTELLRGWHDRYTG